MCRAAPAVRRVAWRRRPCRLRGAAPPARGRSAGSLCTVPIVDLPAQSGLELHALARTGVPARACARCRWRGQPRREGFQGGFVRRYSPPSWVSTLNERLDDERSASVTHAAAAPSVKGSRRPEARGPRLDSCQLEPARGPDPGAYPPKRRFAPGHDEPGRWCTQNGEQDFARRAARFHRHDRGGWHETSASGDEPIRRSRGICTSAAARLSSSACEAPANTIGTSARSRRPDVDTVASASSPCHSAVGRPEAIRDDAHAAACDLGSCHRFRRGARGSLRLRLIAECRAPCRQQHLLRHRQGGSGRLDRHSPAPAR